MNRDEIYATPQLDIAGFRFDEAVVSVFPDMIKRSVPGYETIIAMTGTLADRYVQDNSNCYDLGCSLGASTLAMRNNISKTHCHIIAVDNSAVMLDSCRKLLSQASGIEQAVEKLPEKPEEKLSEKSSEKPLENQHPAVTFYCEDICDTPIHNASLVVMNFTLQFIPLEKRQALLHKIATGLLPGGVLVLSEKVAFEDEQHQQLMIDLHHNFKRANGYSELEISQKRSALEDVLIPETLATHRQRLKDAGFSSVDVWFQCFNFASLIAIK